MLRLGTRTDNKNYHPSLSASYKHKRQRTDEHKNCYSAETITANTASNPRSNRNVYQPYSSNKKHLYNAICCEQTRDGK